MRNGHFAFALCLVGALSGCVHSVHINHTSDYQLDKPLADHRVIKARGEQFTVLGIVGQTDFVEEAFEALQRACPEGAITGIQTRYSTSLGFFSWTHIVDMTGYCSP